MNREGQETPLPPGRWAQLPRWKKAVVTLHADDKIEFF